MSDVFISREQAEQDLLAAAAYIGERIRSVDGRAEAMNSVVPLYLERGEVDLAAELANTVDDPFFRDKLLTQVAAKCAELDDDEYALQLADTIEDIGLRAEAMERIGLVKARGGHLDAARDIAGQMTHPDFVEAAVAISLEADGRENEAVEAIESIAFASARVQAFQQIARRAIANDQNDKAMAMIERSAISAEDVEHIEERIRSMCDNGNLYAAAKRNDLAVETFAAAQAEAETVTNVHRDYFLGTCALGYLTAGSRDLAERCLDLVSDKTHMAAALLGFAREIWKADKAEALELLDEAFAIVESQKETETRDSRSRNVLWTSIATQFAGFGKTDRGLEIASRNVDEAERTNAVTQIVAILIEQNEHELARQTALSLDEPSERAMALVAAADASRQAGNEAAAAAFLADAHEVGDTVPQPPARAGVFSAIAARLADDTDEASNALEKAIKSVEDVRDESRRAATIAELSVIADRGVSMTEASRSGLQRLLVAADS